MTMHPLYPALCILLLSATAGVAKGGGVGNKHDVWDVHHVDNLPPEIQRYIAEVCKSAPRAHRDFATYLPQEKRWRINLEYLQCSGLGEFRRGNECLDVDFVAEGTHFRLARKTYAACGF